ncbi:MAG: hypothetical protein AAF809_09910 [Bacteroidota bacterium]
MLDADLDQLSLFMMPAGLYVEHPPDAAASLEQRRWLTTRRYLLEGERVVVQSRTLFSHYEHYVHYDATSARRKKLRVSSPGAFYLGGIAFVFALFGLTSYLLDPSARLLQFTFLGGYGVVLSWGYFWASRRALVGYPRDLYGGPVNFSPSLYDHDFVVYPGAPSSEEVNAFLDQFEQLRVAYVERKKAQLGEIEPIQALSRAVSMWEAGGLTDAEFTKVKAMLLQRLQSPS